MDPKIIWLFVFVFLYWGYCIFWGVKGALSARTASDYFIAGRGISIWVFVLAATATSFSGWTFMGHPGLLYRDGFQYAYASFYAITIPFTGVMFLKRQWMLGKRFGFVTPGEMLSSYFRGDAIRLLTVLVALCFSIPYLGLQLRASGFLFNVLTNDILSVNVGMWLLSAVVFIYVASGGLRAVAYVDTLQCVLLAFGIVAIGIIALSFVGGWGALNEGIAALSQLDEKRTADGYSHYIAIPGVIQFVASGPSATGGAWTGIMILTYMFALMGIHSAPAFTMWAFSNKSPQPFAPQQVWASSFGIGLILFFFTAMQGLGGHMLGADLKFLAAYPDLANNVMGVGLGGKDLMESAGKQGMLVPQLINLMSDVACWCRSSST
jgi:Na+/proline symporter